MEVLPRVVQVELGARLGGDHEGYGGPTFCAKRARKST
jgi:hypothetical protein